MRVAIFTNTYHPTINGVALCVEAYRRGLEERGHEVFVFAPCPADWDPAQDDERVFRFPAVPFPGDWEYDIAVPYSRPVMSVLRDVRFDLVHTQHPLWVGMWGAWFARWMGLPLVTTAHSNYELYTRLVPLPEQLVVSFIRTRVAMYCNKCHVVTAPVPSAQRRLQEWGVATPIEIVPNPVDLSYLTSPHPEVVRSRWGIPADAFVMGFVGRVAPEKNLYTVLEAGALVMHKLPHAWFVVVGDGADLKGLRSHAEKLGVTTRTVFAGRVEHHKIADYQAALDCFITASRSETMPLSYMEAMAVGTPVVGMKAPGVQDMIQDGVNGLVSQPEEGAQGLADRVLRIATDRALRERIIAAARQDVQRHSVQHVIARLLEVYHMARERQSAATRQT